MVLDRNIVPGQLWTYKTMEGHEDSRIVIGSLDNVPNVGEVICISIINAPVPEGASGAIDGTTMPFIPFSRDAIIASILKLDGTTDLHENFETYYYSWLSETKGEDFMTTSVPAFLELLHSKS